VANWKISTKPRPKNLPADKIRPRTRRARKSRVTGRGGRHGRTMTFLNAAARRLAWNDYEKVSVAMICRDARSTPYTFYKRFPSKPAFFHCAVLVTFRERTKAFSKAMDAKLWEDVTPQAIVYRLVDEVVANTLTVATIGMTQLAMRLAMSKPKGAEPYLEFRAAIIGCGVELLSNKLKIQNPRKAVREAMQMILAMATDEAWRHGIPFNSDRQQELAESYSNLVFRCLALPPAKRDPEGAGTDHFAITELSEHLQTAYGISKPALRRYTKAVNASRKPAFKLGSPTKPVDAVILQTKAENRKTDKSSKRNTSKRRKFRML